MPDLRVCIGSLTLRAPVLTSAGTFGYGVEFARHGDLTKLGGVITKTLTRRPREGNPPPRIVETDAGMLNAVGLQNVGLEAFLLEKLPRLVPLGVPVIVSLLSESPEELEEMANAVDRADGVAAIELNLSCPNIKKSVPKPEAGSQKLATALSSFQPPASSLIPQMVAQDPDATFDMVQAATRATKKPVIAKLSPEVTDLAPIAQAAERAGAAALSLVNTFVGMSVDPQTRRSRLGSLTGGLSGPAIRPLAVYRVWYTAQTVRIPVIGVGGIVRAEHALEFFLAGATAVAVGTAHFADPRAALKVLSGIERYLRQHRLPSIAQLRGAVIR